MDNQLLRNIPQAKTTLLYCAAAILISLALTFFATLVSPVIGIIVLVFCGMAMILLLKKHLLALFDTLFNMERACRTRLLEKYLSGDVPPKGDLTVALPDQQSDYFAVAMLQCIDFSGMFPDCMEDHIPNHLFHIHQHLHNDKYSKLYLSNYSY